MLTDPFFQSTKAGHVVGKLRNNNNADIKRAASEIVNKWKKAVETEKAKKQQRAAVKMSSPASTPRGTASPAPGAASTTTKFQGDPEKRKFDVDGVDIRRTGKDTRDNCIGLMYNGLAYRSTEPAETILVKAVEVEAAAHSAYGGETSGYKTKLRSLFQNLKNKSNPALAKRVLSGDILPEKFVVMDSDELKSAELKKLEDTLAKENMKKAQVPMAEKSISDALQCGKCKQKKVSYSQAQTRSADEPMTTFCECTVCGNRWKVSLDCCCYCYYYHLLLYPHPGICLLTCHPSSPKWLMAACMRILRPHIHDSKRLFL